jgi:hypothetical protein
MILNSDYNQKYQITRHMYGPTNLRKEGTILFTTKTLCLSRGIMNKIMYLLNSIFIHNVS